MLASTLTLFAQFQSLSGFCSRCFASLVLGSPPAEQHGFKHSSPHKAATGPSSHSRQCPIIHELRVLTEISTTKVIRLQSPEDGQASEILLIMTKPHRHFLRCRKLTSAMLETVRGMAEMYGPVECGRRGGGGGDTVQTSRCFGSPCRLTFP